jgi:uncharacterized protein (DUF58 family)
VVLLVVYGLIFLLSLFIFFFLQRSPFKGFQRIQPSPLLYLDRPSTVTMTVTRSHGFPRVLTAQQLQS